MWSLAARACAGLKGLDSGMRQSDTYGDLSDYLSPNPVLFDLLNGPLMLIICEFIWTSIVIDEIGACLKALNGVASVWGGTTSISSNFKEGAVTIESVSNARFSGFALVMCLRLVVAIALGIAGASAFSAEIAMHAVLRFSHHHILTMHARYRDPFSAWHDLYWRSGASNLCFIMTSLISCDFQILNTAALQFIIDCEPLPPTILAGQHRPPL